MGRGGGDYRSEEKRRKKKTMQVGKTEKRGKKEDARSVLRTPALLNEVVPKCLRSSLERLPPASLRC